MKQKENFNIIIAGYGGQGVLTLADIIARAAFLSNYDIKQAELHGLAQRGGSLQINVKFGKKIYSPLVLKGQADLIIALDALEALRACSYANKKTIIITNKKVFRLDSLKKVLRELKARRKVYSLDADRISEKITGNITSTNILMLGYAIRKKILPLKRDAVWLAIKEKIKPEFLDEARKVFDAA